MAFLLAWNLLSRVPLLAGLGLDPAFLANDKVSTLSLDLLSGLPGRLWLAAWHSLALMPGMLAAIWLGVTTWRNRRREEPTRWLVLFLCCYLPLGWLAIAALPLSFQVPGPDGLTPEFRVRYTAHLHPVAMAVLALWASQRSPDSVRGLRPALLAILLLILAPTSLRLMEPGNLRAGLRFDGVRAFAATFDLNDDAEILLHAPLGGTSPSFIKGLALLHRYQYDDYWQWDPPRLARRSDHSTRVQAHWMEEAWTDPDVDEEEFMRGVGYALSVLFPPSKRALFDRHRRGLPRTRGGP